MRILWVNESVDVLEQVEVKVDLGLRDTFVGCRFTASLDGTQLNLVELDDHLHFLSPFPGHILARHTIRRDIRDHARRTRDAVEAVALDYAAIIDFLTVCLYAPRINWIPGKRMDELWHILVKERCYKRVCSFLAEVIDRHCFINYVEHVPNPERRPELTHVLFTEQVQVMRSLGVLGLPDYLERSAAASCEGGCRGVVPLVPRQQFAEMHT